MIDKKYYIILWFRKIDINIVNLWLNKQILFISKCIILGIRTAWNNSFLTREMRLTSWRKGTGLKLSGWEVYSASRLLYFLTLERQPSKPGKHCVTSTIRQRLPKAKQNERRLHNHINTLTMFLFRWLILLLL